MSTLTQSFECLSELFFCYVATPVTILWFVARVVMYLRACYSVLVPGDDLPETAIWKYIWKLDIYLAPFFGFFFSSIIVLFVGNTGQRRNGDLFYQVIRGDNQIFVLIVWGLFLFVFYSAYFEQVREENAGDSDWK